MVQQIEITLKPKRRGFHLVTSEILSQLPKLPKTGIVNIFTKHTSCGLSINEIDVAPDLQVTKMQLLDEILKEMASNTFSDEEQAEFWDDFDNLQKANIIR